MGVGAGERGPDLCQLQGRETSLDGKTTWMGLLSSGSEHLLGAVRHALE